MKSPKCNESLTFLLKYGDKRTTLGLLRSVIDLFANRATIQ